MGRDSEPLPLRRRPRYGRGVSNAEDSSPAWVAEEAWGLRLRREGLAWHVWHPRRPWIALVHRATDGEAAAEWCSVLDVASARVLVARRVDGETRDLAWVGDDELARVHRGGGAVRVDLLAVPDGGVIASGRLPFRAENPVRAAWLPAARWLVVRGELSDDGARERPALCALDPELRLLHTVDAAALNPGSPSPYFDVMALDPDGRSVALWFPRGQTSRRQTHVAIASWSGAAPVRWIAVERMRGRLEYFGDEFGNPLVHGARWSSADRVEFYGQRDTARVDPRGGRCVVEEDDNSFRCDDVCCRELADAPEARVTLCIATDFSGPAPPRIHWGLRFDEGAGRVACLLPWRRADGWEDEEDEAMNHATSAAGLVALLTGAESSPDEVAVRVVDLRAGHAGMRAAEVATLAGRCGTIALSFDARWVFVATRGRGEAAECRVFPTGDLAWAPMTPPR